jgi:Ca2+-binding RTX toxin-like protein
LLAGATTLTGALTGGADSFTLRASGADGYANTGALSLAQVETLTIVLDDNSGAVATAAFDLNLDAVNTSTVTVSGDAGITFANSALTLVSVMDASGVTATGAGGAVTFTGNNITSTITGGAGDDALTGGTQDDVISGGIGADALTGGAGNDVINGGDGADMITGGAGADTLTGGEGADTFIIAADAVDVITDFVAADDFIDAGVTVLTYEAITDDGTIAAAADLAAATVAAFALAAVANDAGIEAIGFEYAGEAYVAVEAGALTNATGAILAQLDDLTGLAAANF